MVENAIVINLNLSLNFDLSSKYYSTILNYEETNPSSIKNSI